MGFCQDCFVDNQAGEEPHPCHIDRGRIFPGETSQGSVHVQEGARIRDGDQIVAVRAELFARFPSALGDLDCRDAYDAIDRSFASGGDDPKVSEYDTFEHQVHLLTERFAALGCSLLASTSSSASRLLSV